MTNEEALYNLKVVIRQTGLKPDTLRAWERRYGLPRPQRSSGGHRLYSLRDIDTIKWLTARQQQGLSIKRAVQLWEQIVAEEKDPIQVPPTLPSAPIPTPRSDSKIIVQLREAWVDACLRYDEVSANGILDEALSIYPVEMVSMQLLQEALVAIGDGWYRGEVTVQQEHFGSALATRRLEAMVLAAPRPIRPGRILAACPPGEEHAFALHLLTLLLRRRGWDVVYLGANVPAERLATTVSASSPSLAVLAAQRLHSAAELLHMADVLRMEGIPVAYGGLIFNLQPALRERIPGHFLGERLDSAAQTVETLIASPAAMPQVPPNNEVLRRCRDHYRERTALIEAQLIQAPLAPGMSPQHLALANRELARSITAALALGDMEYVGADIEWLHVLFSSRHLPNETLLHYLEEYHQAARSHLGAPGKPILRWLEDILGHSGRR